MGSYLGRHSYAGCLSHALEIALRLDRVSAGQPGSARAFGCAFRPSRTARRGAPTCAPLPNRMQPGIRSGGMRVR